jgi:hypothetical protein
MSEAYSGGAASGAIRHEGGHAAARGAADWLHALAEAGLRPTKSRTDQGRETMTDRGGVD